MTYFSEMLGATRKDAETRVSDARERRRLAISESRTQFDAEVGSLSAFVSPLLDEARETLDLHGITATITKGWLDENQRPPHPEIEFFLDGPVRRNAAGSLSSPHSARASFHYELDDLVAEVTDYSFSTIRHVVGGAADSDKIGAALKRIVESYYLELEHLQLEGFLVDGHATGHRDH